MISKALRGLVVAASMASAAPAFAQDPVDIGVIKNSDIAVVQQLLYPKEDRTELGLHLGLMPFDTATITPNLQFTYNMHLTEMLSLSAQAGGGWGFKSLKYLELESPRYGVAYDAYRYLANLGVGIEYAPVYAKANLNGARILHYDVYGLGRVGATLEQSVLPSAFLAVAPTLSVGLGTRFFLGENSALRFEIRDDLMIEARKLTQTTHFKQNVNVTVGYSILSPRGK